MPPRKPSRPSRAAVARLERQLAEQAAQARELHRKLVPVLASYQPTGFPPELQQPVRDFMTEVLTLSQLTGAESARKMLTHLGHLVAYGLERGRPLEISAMLTGDFIDEYIARGMTGSSADLRAQRRGRLLNVARAVNPGPSVPPKLAPIPYLSIKPCYAPTELSQIVRACGEQSTMERKRDLSTLVGLGAGAGADSLDVRYLLVGHVADDGERMQVQYQQPRPRVVPVRTALVPILRSGLAGRPLDSLVLGQKVDRTNLTSRILSQVSIYGGPTVEMSRLRATWLADLMTDPIPIAVILQAAGLKSARSLADLLPHLDPWMTAKGLTEDGLR